MEEEENYMFNINVIITIYEYFKGITYYERI